MRRVVYWLVAAGVLPGALWSADVAEQAPAADKAGAETPKPAEPAKGAPASSFNEITGKILSIGTDPQVLRVTVAGGINVEFTYDAKTVMVNGGKPVSASDLAYGDEVVVHYSGKELYAVEVDRVSKAPRLNLQ